MYTHENEDKYYDNFNTDAVVLIFTFSVAMFLSYLCSHGMIDKRTLYGGILQRNYIIQLFFFMEIHFKYV